MPRRKNTRPLHLAVQSTEPAVAFERLRPQFMKLPGSSLLQPNLDIPAATTLVRGVAPRIQSFRDEIASKLPAHPIIYVDNLVDYSLAAWQGFLINMPPASKDQVQALLTDAGPLRERVLDAAETLARGGLLSVAAVAEIRAGQGQLDTANDLAQLYVLLTASWPKIHNKTHITLEEVALCGKLGGDLHAALSERAYAKPTAETAELRARAFTLFVNVYDEDRRALSYLRWHEGDVDEIAPNLYAHNGGTRRKAAEPPADGASAQKPGASSGGAVASGTNRGGTSNAGAANGADKSSPTGNTPAPDPNATGRGGSPFTQDPNRDPNAAH